jgi:hypothetical protein
MDLKNHTISLPLFLVGIIISVFATLIIVDNIVVDRDQAGCERRQAIFRALAVDPALEPETRLEISENIVLTCQEAFPPIVPFTRI